MKSRKNWVWAGIDFEDIKDMLNDARRKGGKRQIEIVDDEDKAILITEPIYWLVTKCRWLLDITKKM